MCLYTIDMLYSTMEYDIVVGKITKINKKNCENSKLDIGDTVICFFDFYQFKICPNNPFMSIIIDDYYLFKIPPKLNIEFVLPIIKYGFLICLIILLIKKKSVITFYANNNVFNIIKKFMNNYININWKPYKDFDQLTDNYVFISNEKWIIKNNSIEHIFDFNENTIINLFGKQNIDIVINMFNSFESLSSIGIFYIPFKDYEQYELSNNTTRFFSIITFSQS